MCRYARARAFDELTGRSLLQTSKQLHKPAQAAHDGGLVRQVCEGRGESNGGRVDGIPAKQRKKESSRLHTLGKWWWFWWVVVVVVVAAAVPCRGVKDFLRGVTQRHTSTTHARTHTHTRTLLTHSLTHTHNGRQTQGLVAGCSQLHVRTAALGARSCG